MAYKMKNSLGNLLNKTDMSKLRSKQSRASKGVSEHQHFSKQGTQGDEPRVEYNMEKSPMKAKTKTYSTEEEAPKKKRTITSNIKPKKKEYEPQGSSDAAMHSRAALAADKKHKAAQNKWRDGDMSGPAPKRSDFKPVW